MPDDITEYFTPDSSGESKSVYKVIVDNTEALQMSQMEARNRQYKARPSSTIALDGIPGIPFERNQPNPDVFYQGEDIVYDVFLFHEGQPVSSDAYDVKVSVKTSPRAYETIWFGSVDNGIYPAPKGSGNYELWIPSAITEKFLAGSYYVDILIQERVGSGTGRYDRKYVLLQRIFNVDYSNFSASPESRSQKSPKDLRSAIEETWPNVADTVGKSSSASDGVFYSTE
jgi:hypothetical protein